MRVVVKEECRKAEKEFYNIPEEQREGFIFFTCADLLEEKKYDVIEIAKNGWYKIVDESGEDYCYPPEMFEIVEK